MRVKNKKWFSVNISNKEPKDTDGYSCHGNKCTGGCSSQKSRDKSKDGFEQVMGANMDRRNAFKQLTAGLLVGVGAVSSACSISSSEASKEQAQIEWEEQFKGNYKLMSKEEKKSDRESVGAFT